MSPLTIERTVHFSKQARGRQELHAVAAPAPVEPGRVPRVSKLMALAIRFEGLLRTGAVRDYAELARLGHVTRARISQIMSLLYLAPDIQEALLFLPRQTRGREPLPLWKVLPIAAVADWRKQRTRWASLSKQILGLAGGRPTGNTGMNCLQITYMVN
jgi:hypothetical protein